MALAAWSASGMERCVIDARMWLSRVESRGISLPVPGGSNFTRLTLIGSLVGDDERERSGRAEQDENVINSGSLLVGS